MGGKSQPPPAPNYSAVANASAKSAKLAYRTAQQQLAWAKQQYYADRKVSDKVIGQALATSDINNRNAQEDRDRYERLYQPLENDMIREAQDYASPQRKAYEMGRAQADVATQFQAQRKAATDQLESFGIDPSSTRYAALDIGLRANEAAARATAGNMAQDKVDALGRSMRSEAINVGKGYPGQIAGQYGTALAAGNQAVNSGLATTATGANTMGTGVQWQGQGNNALNTWGNTLNMGYNNALGAYNAQQQASSGLGSALGMIGGLGFRAFGFADGGEVEPLHDNVRGVPIDDVPMSRPPAGQSFGLEAGGDVPEREQGASSPHYVSPDLSPSNGKAVDDVPARLNAGEFVIPKDTVEWFGEKYFHNLIAKSHGDKERTTAKSGAQPEMKQALPTGDFA